MVHNGPGLISDEVRSSLQLAACIMALEKRDKTRVNTQYCHGVIRTDWDTHLVCTRSGILFRAHIESADSNGTYLVNFLLSEADLKRGADFLKELEEMEDSGLIWVNSDEPVPCDVLFQFEQLDNDYRASLN
jgi:hypothetical protein